jgi:hypothetical protein
MTLAAAIKLGAVCMAVWSADAPVCLLKGQRLVICIKDRCFPPAAVARSPRLLAQVYGEQTPR